MATDENIKEMAVFAGGLLVLAITSVVGIIVLDQFKVSTTTIQTLDANNVSQVNTTLDLFIASIAVFGTFATIIALILIAKVILGLLRSGFN